MEKVAKIFIIMVSLLFVLSGCAGTGGIELQQMGIVVGIGVDIKEDNEEEVLCVTLEIANYSKSGNDKNPQLEDKILSGEGENITDAIYNVNKQLNKSLFWGHNKVIIFGKSIAEKGINQYIDAFVRNDEMRPNALLMIADGEAAEIFKGKCGLSSLVSNGLSELFAAKGKFTADDSWGCSVQQYTEMLLYEYPVGVLPLIITEEIEQDESASSSEGEQNSEDSKKEVKIGGYVVLSSEGRFITGLTGSEQLGMFIWQNNLNSAIITANVGDNKYSVLIYSPDITIKYKNKKFSIDVSMQCKLFEAEKPQAKNTEVNVAEIENAVKEMLEKALQEAYQKEIENNLDFLYLGEYLYRYHNEELKSFNNFPAELDNAKINVNVKVVYLGEIYNSI